MTQVSDAAASRRDSFRAVQRRLEAALGPSTGVDGADVLLELEAARLEAPRLISAEGLEDGGMRSHRVPGVPVPAFAAFLDGTQASRVAKYLNGYAIVHGTVAAVVRLRRDRRFTTWRAPVVRSRLYAPMAVLSVSQRHTLRALHPDVVDTTAASELPGIGSHPFTIRDTAVHLVQKEREAAERELAERWCESEQDPLFIDGGISGSERLAVSEHTVGVVKSHRTLYADGEALQAVLRLRKGERSSVFRVSSPRRTTVASWYLRLREQPARDPLWGLVRIEVALAPRATAQDLAARADDVSRWVLAEVAPLSLPDARWDRMAYGILDCERYLKAVVYNS